MRTVRLHDGTQVPAIGQGTWRVGERHSSPKEEEAALRLGIELGMTLIDTAEMYGDGAAEEIVGRAIARQRRAVFLVSKVYPHNASQTGLPAACERSLRRMRTDHLDLYLLHWRGSVPIAETVDAFEALREAGKIRAWGVSNFDADAMDEVAALPAGRRCATDQVLYNPADRGIEFDLLPSCKRRRMPVIAYSPLGRGGRLLKSTTLAQVAERHGASPAQIALAWAIRHPDVIAIPKATQPDHVRANAAAAAIALNAYDLAAIDAAFPPPKGKQPLGMI